MCGMIRTQKTFVEQMNTCASVGLHGPELMFTMWSSRRAPFPFCLDSDTRRLTLEHCLGHRCRRCGRHLVIRRGVCFGKDGLTLCFYCSHWVRWPLRD